MRDVSIAGRRFGRLTAVYYAGSRSWVCNCECGKVVRKRTSQLLQGRVLSCGCLRAETARARVLLPPGESGFNALYRSYEKSAKRKGHAFELNQDHFRALTSSACFYCGAPPSQTRKIPKGETSYTYNGIDRKDNRLGYTSLNSVPCCWLCNRLKGAMSASDFCAHAGKIATRQMIMRFAGVQL